MNVSIEISANAQKVLARMEKFPAAMAAAMGRAMDQQNQLTVAHIQATRLSGKGPFPVAEHRLGEKTGRLRSSVHRTDAVVSQTPGGFTVVSSIGSNVKYAAIHEYGGIIRRTQKAGSVRLRTDHQGNLIRQGKNGKLAVFAKSTHKRFKSVDYAGGKKVEAVIPARAPFSTGIEDRLPSYKRALSNAIIAVWNGQQSGGAA